MKIKTHLLILFILFSSNVFYGQDTIDDNISKISSVFEKYFDLEREAIHLHLNKTDFLTNENIWFKGYILNRNNKKTNSTTNIYAFLFDEYGNKITDQLIFAYNGQFTGNIKLNENLNSGRYYIQTYTNWMNNFNENESTIIPINIINPKQGYKNYEKVNYKTLSIEIMPEGGKLIKDINNTIGIHVLDCQNNSIKNLTGTVINSRNEEIVSFKLNQFGYGKIELTPTKNDLKIIINTPDGTITKDFPKLENIGFGFDINSYTFSNKTIIKIKSNLETIKNNNTVYLTINQDEKSLIEKVFFNSEIEKTIVINNKNLFEGILNVRLLDKNLNQLAERLIYSPLQSSLTDVQINEKNIKLINQNQGNVSVSILPENRIRNDFKTPIIVGLKINPYLSHALKNANYYFTNINRQKQYELDLVLLNQKKTKYYWDYMKTNPPKKIYSFDIGLTLKGTVESGLLKNERYKVKMFSLPNFISELTDVDDKGEFIFKNLVFSDSTNVEFLLLKSPQLELKNSKIIANVIDVKKPFYKALNLIQNINCEVETEYIELDFPKLKRNTVQLNEVILENKYQKEKLIHQNDFGNFMLRSFKINDSYRSTTLLTFIARHGFIVIQNGPFVRIIARTSSMVNSSSMRSSETNSSSNEYYGSSNRSSGPEISVDGRLIVNTDEIKYLNMDEIDEIFLSPNINPIGINNNQGIIKIYLKKSYSKSKEKKTTKYVIKEGFSKIEPYKRLEYESSLNSGLKNFGIYDWKPNCLINENGEIEVEVKNFGEANVEIEGVLDNGKIIQYSLLSSKVEEKN